MTLLLFIFLYWNPTLTRQKFVLFSLIFQILKPRGFPTSSTKEIRCLSFSIRTLFKYVVSGLFWVRTPFLVHLLHRKDGDGIRVYRVLSVVTTLSPYHPNYFVSLLNQDFYCKSFIGTNTNDHVFWPTFVYMVFDWYKKYRVTNGCFGIQTCLFFELINSEFCMKSWDLNIVELKTTNLTYTYRRFLPKEELSLKLLPDRLLTCYFLKSLLGLRSSLPTLSKRVSRLGATLVPDS